MGHRTARMVGAGLVGVMAAGAGVFALAPQAGAVLGGHIAGYVAPPSAAVTQTVVVTFRVPKVNCAKVPAGGFQAVLAGARLVSAVGNTGGGAVTICSGPSPIYQPLIEISGTSIATSIVINPGDIVTLRASDGVPGASVTLIDGTQTQASTGSGGVVASEDLGDIAVNCLSAGPCTPVPKASVTKYTGAAIDGLNPAAAGAAQEFLVDVAGAPEMTSTPLTTKKTLNAFKAKWVSSCSTGPGLC